MQRAISSNSRPRVVIIGAGFGGLSAAKTLRKAPVNLTVIDRHNYHLFQPLLYQVATAGLSPADIAAPIRHILAKQANTTVMLAEVSSVDIGCKEIVADGRPIPFDKLIIATGAQHAYFGHHEWEAYAPGLKSIDDATYLRRRILLAFEKGRPRRMKKSDVFCLTLSSSAPVRPALRWPERSPNWQGRPWPETSEASIRRWRGSLWLRPVPAYFRPLIRPFRQRRDAPWRGWASKPNSARPSRLVTSAAS